MWVCYGLNPGSLGEAIVRNDREAAKDSVHHLILNDDRFSFDEFFDVHLNLLPADLIGKFDGYNGIKNWDGYEDYKLLATIAGDEFYSLIQKAIHRYGI